VCTMIGRTLGSYRLVEQIGMGGMATVYKAYDPDTDRFVAIKVLPEHFSRDPTFRQRFEREAKAIAKLEHLHILPLFAYGEDNGTAYMVMRYLKAGSLTDRIRLGPLRLDDASRLLNQIAGALDHAHAHGVLHRDVKPSNVLLDADGNAFLTDFGIAKIVESAIDLTGAGILGTPAYMSPEQCRGNAELTPASDQYSLGIILYEMVTGCTPFRAETPIALIHMQLNDPLPMPRQVRPDLPEDGERVILKALTKEPELRYENCNAMAAAFARAVAAVPAAQFSVTGATLAAESPVAMTASVVEDVTVLHDAAPVAAKRSRGLPWWAWALMALLVIGLGALAVGLILSGADEEPATIAREDAGEVVEEDTSGEDENVEPDVEGEPDEAVSNLPELPQDYREVRPCDWEGHGPGLCIYGRHSDQPVRRLLQDEDLEGFSLPVWSPDGEEIVFSAIPAGGDCNKDFALYRVRADGTELTKLPQLVNDLYPDWSPDGKWLAFHSGCNLAVMHPDGSAPKTLWEHDEDWCVEYVSWAPDSNGMVVSLVPAGEFRFPLERQIQFFSEEDSYLIQSTIFENEECVNLDVAFSPDGTQVAYFDNCRPMLVHVSGDGRPRPVGDFPYHWQKMAYPRWQGEMPVAVKIDGDEPYPEFGKRIVEQCDGLQPPQICMREVETDQVHQITHDLDFESIYGMTWSPDGGDIVFDGGRDGEGHDLFMVTARTSELWPLTDTDDNDVLPAWSPTGEWIAFHRNCGLWLVRPDGAEEMLLHEGSDQFCLAATGWSPDGRNLAYVDYEYEPRPGRPPGEIWVRSLDREGERVIFELEPDIDPWSVTWDPAGREVLFLFGRNDDRTHALLLDPRGEKEPKKLDENNFDRLQVWNWLPNFWPQ
jgi:serine/threonine-protein kinase